MTAPLNLAALKALHEATTKGEWYGNLVVCIGNDVTDLGGLRNGRDAAFIAAAHTHWLELLAMADTHHRLCAHVRIAACGPNHSMGDRFAEVDSLKERAEKAEAEKAAIADEIERLRAEVATLNEPILLALSCPGCGLRHIDQGEWETRPHRTHRCVDGPFGKGCGNEWRPTHVHTVGVTDSELEY